MNFLFSCVGRRGELIKDFRKALDINSKIVATDSSAIAPALYFADKQYIVPTINNKSYLTTVMNICRKENIDAITTFIDPEIAILSSNREKFKEIGVEVLAPFQETAKLCFDKYAMYQYLLQCGIKTPLTFENMSSFIEAYHQGKIKFPVFVKPRKGSGSIGAKKISTLDELATLCTQEPALIIQEFMDGLDIDADVYIDTISHKPVSIFTKKKLETKIGGANKTISFKDDALFSFIENAILKFQFNGPIDMDLFYKNGEYYLSEINPRFGGAYLHAYGAGVDFVKLLVNNLNGVKNAPQYGNYEEDVLMMMYDSVVIRKKSELVR